ncbi:hypothetical protein EVAR_30044_1 [Eumeta japonica]|uniref:Uncharacterized protein n=1 Tax=Eumeta variegata TaxID=151549 RepID=A0A4C1VUJ7_EUMVA|nr:hypothetical protein EVAR_30044_1 [Eumeta japonica]
MPYEKKVGDAYTQLSCDTMRRRRIHSKELFSCSRSAALFSEIGPEAHVGRGRYRISTSSSCLSTHHAPNQDPYRCPIVDSEFREPQSGQYRVAFDIAGLYYSITADLASISSDICPHSAMRSCRVSYGVTIHRFIIEVSVERSGRIRSDPSRPVRRQRRAPGRGGRRALSITRSLPVDGFPPTALIQPSSPRSGQSAARFPPLIN